MGGNTIRSLPLKKTLEKIKFPWCYQAEVIENGLWEQYMICKSSCVAGNTKQIPGTFMIKSRHHCSTFDTDIVRPCLGDQRSTPHLRMFLH